QVEVSPPTIVMVVNDPALFEGRYERYLLNQLRETLPFSEVPIRLIFKPRQRLGLDEMKKRGVRKSLGDNDYAPADAAREPRPTVAGNPNRRKARSRRS